MQLIPKHQASWVLIFATYVAAAPLIKPALRIDSVSFLENSRTATAQITVTNPSKTSIIIANPILLKAAIGDMSKYTVDGFSSLSLYVSTIGPDCYVQENTDSIYQSRKVNIMTGVGGVGHRRDPKEWYISSSQVTEIPKRKTTTLGKLGFDVSLTFCKDSVYRFVAKYRSVTNQISDSSLMRLTKFLDSVDAQQTTMTQFRRYKRIMPDVSPEIFNKPDLNTARTYLESVKLIRKIQNLHMQSDTIYLKPKMAQTD